MNAACLTVHCDGSENNVYSLVQLCHFASIFGKIPSTCETIYLPLQALKTSQKNVHKSS